MKILFCIALLCSSALGSIYGRVTTAGGRGIDRVFITVWNANTEVVQATALTSAFGYYRVDVPACGFTYIVYAEHKRFLFYDSPQFIVFSDDEDGEAEINFTVR